GQWPAQLLLAAISAGGGGGGILPGCNPVSEELVSGTGAGADGGSIHDGGAVVGSRGRTVIRRAPRPPSHVRPGGMAMDVPDGGDSGGPAGRRRVGLSC